MARQVYADNVDANGKVFETVGENIRNGARAGELLNYEEILEKIDALDPEISALQADTAENKKDIEKNGNDLSKLENDTTVLQKLKITTKRGCYSLVTKDFYYVESYECVVLKCSNLDSIYVTSTTGVGSVVLAMYYSDTPSENTFISAQGIEGERKDYVDELLSIPKNAKYVAINCLYDNADTFTIKQRTVKQDTILHSMACNVSNNVIEIKPCKYNNDNDLVVTLKNSGGNNLFDFYSVSKIKNDGDISINFDGKEDILVSDTDWIMPFIVYAKENVDGDNPTSNYFTGGNHRTTNNATGGGITAVQNNLKIIVDGVEISEYKGYCNEIKIMWSNDVQGFNTSKEDGTGRAILTCNYNMTIRNGEFYIETELIPKEKIGLKKWYGYAIFLPNGHCVFIGSDANRNTCDMFTELSIVDKKAVGVKCKSNVLEITATIDKNIDLGSGEYVEHIGNTGYNKSYLNFVEGDFELDANTHYFGCAKYTFSFN